MKLETWIDGNMDIMHVISFCSYVNEILVAMATNTIKKNIKKSDNGGAGRGHHVAWQ